LWVFPSTVKSVETSSNTLTGNVGTKTVSDLPMNRRHVRPPSMAAGIAGTLLPIEAVDQFSVATNGSAEMGRHGAASLTSS
jgi:hypothetical protein